jgi:hypothetical protein
MFAEVQRDARSAQFGCTFCIDGKSRLSNSNAGERISAVYDTGIFVLFFLPV